MDNAIVRLKQEGYTSEEIREAIRKLAEEVMQQPVITGSLDDYLDSLEDDEE